MPSFVLTDIREYIFPLFMVEATDNTVSLESRQFLGTAFFVSKLGDAITADHVLPKPNDIPQGKRVVAIVQFENKEKVCWVLSVASFVEYDLAFFKVNIEGTKYLELTDDEILPGEDVNLVGMPNHEVWLSGKETRLLKGHVTMVAKQLELNFQIPAGMSGSPMFFNGKVAAYATGTIKSEEVEDYSEEEEIIANDKGQIRITKTIRVTQYGMAYPFSKLKGIVSPIFDDLTLIQFVQKRNS